MTKESGKSREDVVRQDGRYPLDVLAFLDEGMAKAIKDVYGEKVLEELRSAAQTPGGKPPMQHYHVTGAQLSQALCELAREKWGMLAKPVLARWNIHSTLDFGRIVYLLVDHRHMSKTESDSIEDFRDVVDFDKVFGEGEFELKE